ncbi:hypothetical protein [Bathymodiolus japonicus methanotrophic gill symbiont]|uniref:hypothetical protein n=1 Tax=Bathymodiolus japonicus methanotrophic gill symbiont TaxID=113269 RepID=UPI001C8DCA84|nr:hypothetical protein [Bathymodiolus japonicus methanotrophic gill symbiont]
MITDAHEIAEGSFVQLILESKAKANYKGNSTIGRARMSSDLFLSYINGKPEMTGKINATI